MSQYQTPADVRVMDPVTKRQSEKYVEIVAILTRWSKSPFRGSLDDDPMNVLRAIRAVVRR